MLRVDIYMYRYSYFTVTFIIRLYLIFISLHNIVCKHQLPVVFKLLMKHIQIIELTNNQYWGPHPPTNSLSFTQSCTLCVSDCLISYQGCKKILSIRTGGRFSRRKDNYSQISVHTAADSSHTGDIIFCVCLNSFLLNDCF